MSERPKISLITITRDEEALIGECLKSAWFCDEKIIIDSFSTDKTVEIARGLGADVVQHEFTNYVKQKQMALDRATGEWVLLMDADEQATHDVGEDCRRVPDSAYPVSPGALLLARDLPGHTGASVSACARAYRRPRSA